MVTVFAFHCRYFQPSEQSWNIVEHCEIVRVRNPSQRSNRRKRTCDSGTAITDSQCNENELQYGNIWNGYVASSNGKVMQSVLCLGPQRQTGTLWNFSGLFLEESTGVHLRGLLHSQKSSKPEPLGSLGLAQCLGGWRRTGPGLWHLFGSSES